MLEWLGRSEADIASQNRRLPPWGRLERIAVHLAEQGRHRDLIVFVEAWTKRGAPTLPARLAVSEAYLSLRILDRAWTRLKDLVDQGRGPIEAVRLASELYLLRGWVTQAVHLAEVGLSRMPGDPWMLRVLEEAQHVRAPEDREEPSTPSEMVQRAEEYIARGAFLRGQGLLERARRRGLAEEDQGRVADLIWAIRGDYSTDKSLEELCDALSPAHEVGRDGEHTEFAPPEGTERRDRKEFQKLFRDLGPASQPPVPGERTSVSVMAGDSDLRGPLPPEDLVPELQLRPAGDQTEILRVVRRRSEGAGGDSEPSLADAEVTGDYVPGSEYEDDSLVVLTKEERPPGRESEPSGESPPPVAADKAWENEALRRLRRSQEQAPVRRSRPRRKSSSRASRPASSSVHVQPEMEPVWPWWLAAAAVLGISLLIVAALVSLLAAVR